MNKSLIAVLAVGLFGCATVDLPPDVESPVGKIAAAEERGVEDNPQAQLHLKLAEEGIAQSKRLAEDKDKKGAKLALMRADADAELALALLRRDSARGEVEEVRSEIKELQSDMEKTTQ